MEKYVVKRDGRKEELSSEKIESRIKNLCNGLNENFVDFTKISQKIISGIFCGVSTKEIDDLGAEVAASMTTKHPDYSILAARIAVSKLHKETKNSFSEVIKDLHNYRNPKNGKHEPIINKETFDIVNTHSELLDAAINYERDFGYNYFGFKTLVRTYLLKMNGKVVERPQQMLMRVAIGIHQNDMDSVIETYNLMSEKWYTHASATLFNAGTTFPQMSSCFLVTLPNNSVDEIFETLKKCAIISNSGSASGVSVSKIQARNNESSKGLVPFLRVFNNASRLIEQGGNKRPGVFAIYLEPWHADIMDFLELKRNTGAEEKRARDLFYALWIPDLFMSRVENDEMWSLMCPTESPGLDDCWGVEFEELYTKYEREGNFKEQIKARNIWKSIITSQIETGTPFMLYKDACNGKSNQKHLGTIKNSNLCTEIVEYTSADEIAVCGNASIALPRFLHKIAKIIVINLDKMIDSTWYPVLQAENSNKRHRPIGLGVQGLADAFQLCRLPFTSDAAKKMNKLIFETIYHAALEASCELAEKYGSYSTFANSPSSNGILQCDLWNSPPADNDFWNWKELRLSISKYGLRNSLLVSLMPTATSAQILGNNESIEPYTSNVYSRRVVSGDFQVVNEHLMKDLIQLNLWNDEIKNMLIAHGGSIQNIPEISAEIKELYKTVWEISQRDIIDMAADRGPFIDQSQSLNLHLASPSYAKCTSMHFYAWKKGLKTGMYYLRSRPAVDAVQFTVDKG
uniref:Ribonucleoside-diphosphate reductase n=1 Tax=Panagrolaimus sp. ES5 TaxID=591445 RepID=A0AC34FBF3_9BILA